MPGAVSKPCERLAHWELFAPAESTIVPYGLTIGATCRALPIINPIYSISLNRPEQPSRQGRTHCSLTAMPFGPVRPYAERRSPFTAKIVPSDNLRTGTIYITVSDTLIFISCAFLPFSRITT
jgi:hypothetical protein